MRCYPVGVPDVAGTVMYRLQGRGVTNEAYGGDQASPSREIVLQILCCTNDLDRVLLEV